MELFKLKVILVMTLNLFFSKFNQQCFISNTMKNSIKILFLFILTLIGCKKTETEKNISAIEFEQNVFKQVFINIVDSTYTDKRIYTRIPTKVQEKNPAFVAETEAIQKDSLNLIIAIDERYDDIKKLTTKKFIFKNFKELPIVENYTNWTKKYKKFIGVMSFTKITFDKAKENGYLEVFYYCGSKCGLGYKVFITNKNGKWKVVKAENTWIS